MAVLPAAPCVRRHGTGSDILRLGAGLLSKGQFRCAPSDGSQHRHNAGCPLGEFRKCWGCWLPQEAQGCAERGTASCPTGEILRGPHACIMRPLLPGILHGGLTRAGYELPLRSVGVGLPRSFIVESLVGSPGCSESWGLPQSAFVSLPPSPGAVTSWGRGASLAGRTLSLCPLRVAFFMLPCTRCLPYPERSHGIHASTAKPRRRGQRWRASPAASITLAGISRSHPRLALTLLCTPAKAALYSPEQIAEDK